MTRAEAEREQERVRAHYAARRLGAPTCFVCHAIWDAELGLFLPCVDNPPAGFGLAYLFCSVRCAERWGGMTATPRPVEHDGGGRRVRFASAPDGNPRVEIDEPARDPGGTPPADSGGG